MAANVARDASGIPKRAVFEHESTAAHRSGVTSVDGSDPADTSGAVDSEGWEVVDFDIDVTLGGTDPVAEVAPIYYNSVAEAWFKGESVFISETGKYRVRCEARGSFVFLKLISLDGTTPTIDMDVWSSLS